MDFDPNAAAAPDGGLFGLPHGPDQARVHVLGVPFEATTSYRAGTSRAPEAILAASVADIVGDASRVVAHCERYLLATI